MIYTFPRAGEYFEPDELTLATGVIRSRFPEAILKELVENALDESEKSGSPVIEITGSPLTVRDNGPGADLNELLSKILGFNVRASSKLAWKRPTRGYLGNALKTVFGMTCVLAPDKPVVFRKQRTKSCGNHPFLIDRRNQDKPGAGDGAGKAGLHRNRAGIRKRIILWDLEFFKLDGYGCRAAGFDCEGVRFPALCRLVRQQGGPGGQELSGETHQRPCFPGRKRGPGGSA